MKQGIIGFALVIALALAACGSTNTSAGGANATTLAMSGSQFTGSTQLTVSVGTSVTFTDSGAEHLLVTGTNGVYAAEAGAPAALETAAGWQIAPGQTETLTFATAGTYHITCLIHPAMNAVITVQ